MDKIRENIENGTFAKWAAQALQSPAFARNSKTKANIENIEYRKG
jgi:hypothetical protein